MDPTNALRWSSGNLSTVRDVLSSTSQPRPSKQRLDIMSRDLQTLAHIPNSRARRSELQYRLERLNRPERIQMLCLAIDDPYPPLRHDVAEGFQAEFNHPSPEFDGELTHFLEAIALGEQPDPQSTRALRVPDDLLPSESMRARITACVSLETSPNAVATARRLSPLLQHENADLRYQVIIATHRLVPASEHLHNAVLDAIEDDDPEIVVVATQIAVMHGWSDLLPQFLHARARLGGEDRLQITFSVGELIDNSELTPPDLPPQARGDMIAECSDALDYEPHTAAAIKTLANLEAREAVERLIKITKGWFTHPILKVEAAAALVDLDAPAGEQYLQRALNSRRKDARGYALRVIGERRLERFYTHLVEVANAQEYHSDTATLALADYGSHEAQRVLENLATTHPDMEVRRLATSSLNRLAAPTPESFDATLDS